VSRTVTAGVVAGERCSARSTSVFSSPMLKGLLTKSKAPSRTASTAFCSSPKPVTMMTGVPGLLSRTLRNTSMPSMRALSLRSLMTRSNGLTRQRASACSGSVVVSISRSGRFSSSCMNRHVPGSSSRTRMREVTTVLMNDFGRARDRTPIVIAEPAWPATARLPRRRVRTAELLNPARPYFRSRCDYLLALPSKR
jgi:hypothetical protein